MLTEQSPSPTQRNLAPPKFHPQPKNCPNPNSEGATMSNFSSPNQRLADRGRPSPTQGPSPPLILAFRVLAVETKRVMQRAGSDAGSRLLNVGSCYERYLPGNPCPFLNYTITSKDANHPTANLRQFVEISCGTDARQQATISTPPGSVRQFSHPGSAQRRKLFIRASN